MNCEYVDWNLALTETKNPQQSRLHFRKLHAIVDWKIDFKFVRFCKSFKFLVSYFSVMAYSYRTSMGTGPGSGEN